ncbi:MAG: hypothetical protein RIG62_10270 [Cyclobacteriaceae bacterium]
MKKSMLLIGICSFFLMLNFSCEDPLEGDITADLTKNMDVVITSEVYTYWKFIYSTADKADGLYKIGFNPETNTNIYIAITDGVVVDAWGAAMKGFITTNSQETDVNTFGLSNPTDPVPGQPSASVLPQFSGCPHDIFCHPDPQSSQNKCIYVQQPKSRRLCIPRSGDIWVYVPRSL